MSTNKDQWGNIELPGLSDEELHAKNWNYVSANREKGIDPIIRQKQSKATKKLATTDKNYIQSYNEGMIRRSESAEWKTNMLVAMAERSKTNWKINQSKAIRQKLAKPIITPNGIFATITDAVNFELNNGLINANKKVYKWLKDPNSGYRYITVEEYTRLTGKNI